MCVCMYMYVYTVCNWSNREEPDEIGTMQSLEMMVELCIWALYEMFSMVLIWAIKSWNKSDD